MSDIWDKATARFDPRTLQSMTVEEWDDTEVHWYPVTLLDKEAFQRAQKNGSDIDLVCEILIRKLVNENGDQLFSKADKPKMKRELDPSVVARIASVILLGASVEDMLGE